MAARARRAAKHPEIVEEPLVREERYGPDVLALDRAHAFALAVTQTVEDEALRNAIFRRFRLLVREMKKRTPKTEAIGEDSAVI